MCLFLSLWLVLPRCGATNFGVFDLCRFALISPYSNGAVQIRVGSELAENFWAAANGGCSKRGFKGCLAALPGNRPFPAFFTLVLPFSPFAGGPEEHQKRQGRGLFLRYPWICLNPHLLNAPIDFPMERGPNPQKKAEVYNPVRGLHMNQILSHLWDDEVRPLLRFAPGKSAGQNRRESVGKPSKHSKESFWTSLLIRQGQTWSVIMWSVVLQQSPQKSDLCDRRRPLQLCETTSGKKKVYTTTVETLLFFFLWVRGSMVYTLFFWTYGVYPFPLFSRKRVYTIACFFFCSVTWGSGDRPEGGVPRWWCILFFPLYLLLQVNIRKFSSPGRNQSQLWIPGKPRKIGVWVSGAEIQTSAVDTRTAVWASTAGKISKIFLGETRNFSRKFRGVSAPALYKNPAVIVASGKKILAKVTSWRALQIFQDRGLHDRGLA